MEEVLKVYKQNYNPWLPVICLDEWPSQLTKDGIAPIPMKKGQVFATRPSIKEMEPVGF